MGVMSERAFEALLQDGAKFNVSSNWWGRQLALQEWRLRLVLYGREPCCWLAPDLNKSHAQASSPGPQEL